MLNKLQRLAYYYHITINTAQSFCHFQLFFDSCDGVSSSFVAVAECVHEHSMSLRHAQHASHRQHTSLRNIKKNSLSERTDYISHLLWLNQCLMTVIILAH